MNEIASSATITVDDLRRKAIQIRDLAEVEVRSVAEERATKMVAIGIVAAVAVVSIAYYLGTRRRSFAD
jgi:hypothetical protein